MFSRYIVVVDECGLPKCLPKGEQKADLIEHSKLVTAQ